MFIILLLSAAILAVANAGLYTDDARSQKFLWENFKNEYGRSYDTQELENQRFTNFLQMLKTIDERNAEEKVNGGSAQHGITRFADLTQVEFEAKYLTADPTMKDGSKAKDTEITKEVVTEGAGSTVDWTGKLTTPVKNQMQCGSCWAFSATEQIESDSMRELGSTKILSPEQIVQCDGTSYGCNGGWTEHAYSYVERAGGLETESAYPYTSGTGITGQCKVDTSAYAVKVTGYHTVKGESSMASYVQSTGPLSVCLDASNWNTYTGGILSKCGKSVDHCVQAVGVDASSRGYWKVRNSWGTTWGESGFIRLAYGSNTCDITNDPTWVDVKAI